MATDTQTQTSGKDRIVLICCVAAFLLVNLWLFFSGRFPVRDAGLPDWTLTLGRILAAAITLAIFSFLYKDNPVFRAVEHLFVGLGLGVTFNRIWFNYLKPDIYDRLVAPIFTPGASIQGSDYILIIPILLGIMTLFRLSQRMGWVSRYPMCFLIGYGSGFIIQPVIHSLILKQVEKTMTPATMHWIGWAALGAFMVLAIITAYYAAAGGRLALILKIACGAIALAYVICRNSEALLGYDEEIARAFRAIDSLALMVGVFSVLCYFFFSAEHKGALGVFSGTGIMFLMVAFGASFGYTVMARESLLIGRLRFLLDEWLGLM